MKKLTCLLTIMVLIFSVAGCKKKAAEPEPVKTAEQLKVEAEKLITEENMEDELKKLEKEIEMDISSE